MLSSVIHDALEDDGYVALLAKTIVRPDTVQKMQPDVIILDLWPGDGPQGWKRLRTLKASPGISTIPVIVCTANSRWQAEQTALIQRHSAAVVIKPFELETFLKQVRAVTTTASPGEARSDNRWGVTSTACAGDCNGASDADASLPVCLLPSGHLRLRTDGGEAPLSGARWRQLGWVWEDGQRMGFIRAEIDGASWSVTVPVDAMPIGDRCTPVMLRRQTPRPSPPLMGWLSFH
jgi:CheY-like chemotaxis protein